jgi:hypothetical protein
MTNASKKFSKKLNSRFAKKQNELARQAGEMGDQNNNLFVPNMDGFVYVTIGNKSLPVFNNRVAPQIGVKIWIGYAVEEPTLYQVLSTRSETPAGVETGYGGYAPAKRYEWHALHGGQDPLSVHLRAFTPLKLSVSDTVISYDNFSAVYVNLYRGFVYTGAGYIAIPMQDVDISAQIPTAAGKAAFVLISINYMGAVIQTKGAEVDIDALVITDIPAIPAGTVFVCGAVRVYTGQTVVQEGRTNTDFVDLRFPGRIGEGTLEVLETSGLITDGFRFGAGGRLAVVTNIDSPLIIARDVTIHQWRAYLQDTGISGATVLDVNKNGTTVFTDQANRPTIAYDSADGKTISGVADVVDFAAGDIVTLDIDAIAPGASNLSVVGSVLNIVTVTVVSGQYKIAGDADPVFTYTSSVAGLTFTGALSRAAGTTAGTYAITIGTLLPPAGYSIVFVSALFEVIGTLAPSVATVIDVWAGQVAATSIDGNDATSWGSSTRMPGGVWCKVDYGASVNIRRIRILNDVAAGEGRATQFKMESSTDNAAWTVQFTSATGLAGGEEIILLPVAITARYLKFTVLAGSGGSGWNVYEIGAKGW